MSIDLSSIFRIHAKQPGWSYKLVIPVVGRWRQVGLWSSLISQGPPGELQTVEKPHLNRQSIIHTHIRWPMLKEGQLRLTSNLHAHHTCTCSHPQTHPKCQTSYIIHKYFSLRKQLLWENIVETLTLSYLFWIEKLGRCSFCPSWEWIRIFQTCTQTIVSAETFSCKGQREECAEVLALMFIAH